MRALPRALAIALSACGAESTAPPDAGDAPADARAGSVDAAGEPDAAGPPPIDAAPGGAADASAADGGAGAAAWELVSGLPACTRYRSVWGTSASNVYFACEDGFVAHWDGAEFTEQEAGGALVALWGSGPGDIYALGRSAVYHSDGSGTWDDQFVTASRFFNLNCIWGSGPNDVYIGSIELGGFGALYHSTGDGEWSKVRSLPQAALALWGSSPTNIYAAGEFSMMFHKGGDGSWDDVSLTGMGFGNFQTIWGNGDGDLYTGGVRILHRAAGETTWIEEWLRADLSEEVFEMRAAPSSALYAVGRSGMVLRADGAEWVPEPTEATGTLFDVWGAPGGPVYAVGDQVIRRE